MEREQHKGTDINAGAIARLSAQHPEVTGHFFQETLTLAGS